MEVSEEKYESISEYIECSKSIIGRLELLNKLVENRDYVKWETKLGAPNGLSDMLCPDKPFNIFTLSSLAGLYAKKGGGVESILYNGYFGRLLKLEAYLQDFPELVKNKKFKDKLKNLEGFNFLATLSELSLARVYKSIGYSVEFETPFWLDGTKKDVDLTVKKEDVTQHIEVYAPQEKFISDGFFNPSEGDDKLVRKVSLKLGDKFGGNGLTGLNGTVLLAINTYFMDYLGVKNFFPGITNEELEVALGKLNVKNIHALLLFHDGFDQDESFFFDNIIPLK